MELRDAIAKEVKDGEKEIDILNWVTRAALELVGQGGLGHSFDPLDRDWKNPYVETLKSLVSVWLLPLRLHQLTSNDSPTFAPLFIPVQMIPLALRIAPPAFWRRIMEALPLQAIRDCLGIVDAMDTTSKAILAKKKELLAQGDAAFEQQVGEGKDIMSVLRTSPVSCLLSPAIRKAERVLLW